MREFKSQTAESGKALYASLLCVCAVATALAASERGVTTQPFGHYQPILDRMPFGAEAPVAAAVDPAQAQTAAQLQADQQKLAKQVNMSAVNVTPDGETAIGFTDLSVNPPVNHFLLVGASADGWKVVSADYDAETATIEKDGVSITLQLGKGLIDPTAQPAKGASPAAPGMTPFGLRRGSPSFRSLGGQPATTLPPAVTLPNRPPPVKPPELAPSDAGGSYMERLRERKQQETKELQAASKKQQEQLMKLAHEAAANEIKKREAEAAAQADANAPQPNEPPLAAPAQEAQ